MAKTKLTPTEQASFNGLKTLIEFAQQNKGSRSTKGTINEVVERMTKLCGKPVHRNMVAKWLHPEADKRVEPLFGVGLMLQKIQTEICHGGIPD